MPWCVLLSRCRQETNEGRLKLAEVNLVLGEVSLESGEQNHYQLQMSLLHWTSTDHYDRGLEDFITCLQLREAVLEPTDRRLAEA